VKPESSYRSRGENFKGQKKFVGLKSMRHWFGAQPREIDLDACQANFKALLRVPRGARHAIGHLSIE
jgi:hypothetical protein